MIKSIILSLVAVVLSCGSDTNIEESRRPTLAESPTGSFIADAGGPSQAVVQFMSLLSSGEIDKAEGFMRREEPDAGDQGNKGNLVKSGEDSGPALESWIGYFRKGNYTLGKVLSENIQAGKATVKTELWQEQAGTEVRTQEMVFNLHLEHGRWFISKIDFVLARPSELRMNANISGV